MHERQEVKVGEQWLCKSVFWPSPLREAFVAVRLVATALLEDVQPS